MEKLLLGRNLPCQWQSCCMFEDTLLTCRLHVERYLLISTVYEFLIALRKYPTHFSILLRMKFRAKIFQFHFILIFQFHFIFYSIVRFRANEWCVFMGFFLLKKIKFESIKDTYLTSEWRYSPRIYFFLDIQMDRNQ